MTCGSYGKNLTVNFKSHAGHNVNLGNNVNFNGMHISSGGRVIIGDNFHSGKNCQIIAQYHNYDQGKRIPYDNTLINKPVKIESNVWIGHNVTILGGVTIGEGAVLQACSVVVCNIPPLSVAGGNPARVFKKRDSDHYYHLKNENKFH
jgi:acetyltransferase-like isoleucine patch superfamily enzyme